MKNTSDIQYMSEIFHMCGREGVAILVHQGSGQSVLSLY